MKRHYRTGAVTKGAFVPAILLAAAAAGCGTTYVPAADYARSKGIAPEAAGSVWRAFAPGGKALVAPSSEGCVEAVGEDLQTIDRGGRPLSSEAWAAVSTVWEVESALAASSGGGYLALALKGEQGRRVWMRIPSGSAPTCVWPMGRELAAAVPLRGGRTVFAPWRTSCGRVEATGTSVAATLLHSEPGMEMDIGGVVLGALAETPGGPTRVPWLEIHGGTVKVRWDSFRSCFAPAGSEDARPPADALALLHVDAKRCAAAESSRGRHVACKTSVGVWEGSAAEDRVSLSLARRTVGQVHFVDGRPVRGDRFAAVVVAVIAEQTRDPRERVVYESIAGSVARALSDSDGTFRVADQADPAVNTRITVAVTDLEVGKLRTASIEERTEYQDGVRVVHNDRKDQLFQELQEAQQGSVQAEQDFQAAIQTYDFAVQEAVNLCQSSCAMQTDPNMRTICQGTCDAGKIAAGIFKPTREGVDAAQLEEHEAQYAYDSEPAEIEEPVMRPWSYKKEVFERGASASVAIRIQPRGEEASEISDAFSDTWTDHRIEADPAHNVEGHTAQAPWIEDPDALLPEVGAAVSGMVAAHLRTAVSRAALRELRREASTNGLEGRGGYEDVDALAVGVAGPRLKMRVQTGASDLVSGRPISLPSRAVALKAGECLLGVAVMAEGRTGAITLGTVDGSHADLRGKAFAVVEICRDELRRGEESAGELRLLGDSGGRALWGLYRTGDAPGEVEEPAPVAPAEAPPVVIEQTPMRSEAVESGAWDDLRNEEPAVRIACIGMITAKKDRGALEELIRVASEDTEADVRAGAWEAIGSLATAADIPRLEPIRLAERAKKARAAARKAVKGLAAKGR